METPGKTYRSRAWAITWWDDQPIVFNPDQMRYLLQAPEICPDSGKHHYQSYVVWNNDKTLSASLKNLKPFVIHPRLTSCLGSFQENLDYIRGPYGPKLINGISKEKPFNPKWTEYGDKPSQGARGDLKLLKDQIVSGESSVNKIVIERPDMYHQYGRTLHKIEDLVQRKTWRTEMTKGLWIWGPTATGKSHTAFEGYSEETHYLYEDDKGWWDAYEGQETVIMNDFRGDIAFNTLLKIVDKWPHKVSRRGREQAQFVSKKVIITSSLPPHKIYKNRYIEDDMKQLYRRFEIKDLTNYGEYISWDSDNVSEDDED